MTITNELDCRKCQICKMTKLPKRTCTGELINGSRNATIHADIYAPMKVRSYGGRRYFLIMTVAHARYTSVHLLIDQKDLEQYFHNCMSWIERNTKVKVIRVHTDNAPEFMRLRKAFERMRILLTTWSAHTPQSIGLAECINGTSLD